MSKVHSYPFKKQSTVHKRKEYCTSCEKRLSTVYRGISKSCRHGYCRECLSTLILFDLRCSGKWCYTHFNAIEGQSLPISDHVDCAINLISRRLEKGAHSSTTLFYSFLGNMTKGIISEDQYLEIFEKMKQDQRFNIVYRGETEIISLAHQNLNEMVEETFEYLNNFGFAFDPKFAVQEHLDLVEYIRLLPCKFNSKSQHLWDRTSNHWKNYKDWSF